MLGRQHGDSWPLRSVLYRSALRCRSQPLLPNHREPAFAENMPVISRCVIHAAASWVAWCAVHSVGPSLEELWMAAEARAGAQEPARSLAAPRAEFKALRSSTGPMHVACAAAGRDALSDSSNGQKRINLPPARLINSISGAPTILPRDTQDAELAAGAGRETSAGIKFDGVVAVHR